MRLRGAHNLVLILAVGHLVIGCEDRPAAERPATPADRAPPTLQVIMVGLGEDARRMGHALWTENYPLMADAATAIANHADVPPAQRQVIARALGDEVAAFAAADRQVHDIAVAIGTAAAEENLEVAVARYGDLTAACVSCHTRFRDRIVPALHGN